MSNETRTRFALRNLRHLYEQMLSGHVVNTDSAARGLLGPAIAKIEQEENETTLLRSTIAEQAEGIRVLTEECDALRESLIHAVDLRTACYEHERQLWAMRQVANMTSEPFGHDRVQEKHESLIDGPSFASVAALTEDLRKAEARIKEVAAERDEARDNLTEMRSKTLERVPLHDYVVVLQNKVAGRLQLQRVRCFHCGLDFGEHERGTIDQIVRDHVVACSEHPLAKQLDSARAECERMRPVYEATLTWRRNEMALDKHAIDGTSAPVEMRQADWQTIDEMRTAADRALSTQARSDGDE